MERNLVPWLLLMGALVWQGCCQHWSYGLSPGGKRDLADLSQTLKHIVEGIPRMDTPCDALECTEDQPYAKHSNLKQLLGCVVGRGSERKVY